MWWGGYNAARGLILTDIASFSISNSKTFFFFSFLSKPNEKYFPHFKMEQRYFKCRKTNFKVAVIADIVKIAEIMRKVTFQNKEIIVINFISK